jgi:CRISPR type III-A/MTUBE-associated protein Csm6
MVNVQQYDVFYQDFRQIIQQIEREMDPEDQLLINMASGTPAMKSALLVMATLAEYRFLPIQVSSPLRKMNEEEDDRKNYDPEINWELNEDNTEAFVNRCEEVKCLHLMQLLKIDMIKKHIRAYDYMAAKRVADEIREDLPDDAYRLIAIAVERFKLNRSRVSQLMQEKSYDIFPVKDGNNHKIFEYTLVLQIKLAKEEYADFIRGITPLVADLLEQILKKQCGISVDDYCTVRNDIKHWNRTRLEKDGLLVLLDEEYKNTAAGKFSGDIIYSNHLATLIRYKSKDSELIEKVNAVAEAERAVRNVAAHEIVSVTDEWFRKRAGKSAQEIFADIRYLIVKAGINIKREQWNSYDQMNDQIEHLLDGNQKS